MSDERLVGSLFHMVVGFIKMCMIISIIYSRFAQSMLLSKGKW